MPMTTNLIPIQSLGLLATLLLVPVEALAAPAVAPVPATTQADIDALQLDITSCRAGLGALTTNLYKYPDKPTVAPAGKRAWKDVYGEFKADQLPACNRVGKFLDARKGQPITQAVEARVEADGVKSFADYFTGRLGVVFHGDRILGYCPNLHRSQYDCVSGSQRIAAISTPRILAALDRLAALECVPETGWASCRKLEGIDGVDFRIYSTAAVSLSAQQLVENTYKDMLTRLQPAYPAKKLDGFKAYITNGEDWSQLEGLYPTGYIGNADELRGSANGDFAWVSEQMICKTGVATRNAAFAAGKRADRDDAVRTLDQVVHEFSHSLDFRFGLEAKYKADLFPGATGFPAVEAWAWGVQAYFGVPAQRLGDRQLAFLNQVFTGRTTYGCSDYKPE